MYDDLGKYVAIVNKHLSISVNMCGLVQQCGHNIAVLVYERFDKSDMFHSYAEYVTGGYKDSHSAISDGCKPYESCSACMPDRTCKLHHSTMPKKTSVLDVHPLSSHKRMQS